MTLRFRFRRALPLVLWTALLCAAAGAPAAAQQSPFDTAAADKADPLDAAQDAMTQVRHAVIRLPLAAVLGAALAVRPRRKGTPPRQPAVIQTQIILAIVGAVVMLVVGSSLARAFGVVGAAGLVRYRAKIEDPKDAGVMLSTLAVGLASGVGQFVMAAFSAGFILVALWIIESFEPEGRKLFELKIKMGKETDERRKDLDALLARYHMDFDLLSSSDEELCYEVWVPLEMQKERISNAILKLDPEGHAAVEWDEKKPKTK
jgi:uncharacterized membrane protein YhiD involved in acid resistance